MPVQQSDCDETAELMLNGMQAGVVQTATQGMHALVNDTALRSLLYATEVNVLDVPLETLSHSCDHLY